MHKTLMKHTLYQAMQCLFNPLPERQIIAAGAQKHLIVSGGIVCLTCQNNSGNVSDWERIQCQEKAEIQKRRRKHYFWNLTMADNTMQN